jgi:phage shock protein A
MSMPGKSRSTRDYGQRVPMPTVVDFARTEKEFNRAGTEFLKTDVATAITFSEAALNTDDPAKRIRNQKFARKAYDTILRLAQKITLQEEDAKQLSQGLEELKANLMRLGEVL